MSTVLDVQIVREDGSTVPLKRRFAEGGQGIVYLVAQTEGEEPRLAKIYKAPEPSQARRLRELIARRNERLSRVVAWPIGLLYDANGAPIGFEMPQVANAFPLYTAYQIRSRLTKLPGRDYKFLVRAARNLAAALHHVHDAGFVVGDLNESNVLVDAEAMVKLIDADSYQVEIGNEVLTCDVGKSELIAPELQNRNLSKLVRTADHDRFSLAVLLFHLLVLGRHPFAGVPRDGREITLEEAIVAGWYPFESEAHEPLGPPAGLTLEWLPDPVRGLFVRAFDPEFAGERPTAQDWFGVIKEMEDALVTCTANPRHVHPGSALDCPWCALEERWNVTLFGSTSHMISMDAEDEEKEFDVDEAWRRIMAIPAPIAPERPAVPDLCDIASAKVSPATTATFYTVALVAPVAASLGMLFAGLQVGAICVIWGVVFRAPAAWVCGIGGKVRNSRKEFAAVKQQMAEMVADWEQHVSPRPFHEAVEQLGKLRIQYRELGIRADQLRFQALSREHGHELMSYLTRFPISAADVATLTNSQAFHLENMGIKTAADVTADTLERHCPEEVRQDVMNWRRGLELHFWQTSMYVPSPSAEARIRKELRKERAHIRTVLEMAPTSLTVMRESILRHEQDLRERIADLLPVYLEVGGRHKAYSSLVGRGEH
ncbi:MAG: protein kinase [Fimbriimonadaceae bacterium]|nr:protein kinase [Fimbriimonadaceae bacterium]